MTKSEEWDKGGGRPVRFNPLGNFKLIVLLGIIVLAITLVIAFTSPTIYARGFDSTVNNIKDGGTFKIFEDGLTYDDGGRTIVLDNGDRIDCGSSWSAFSYREMINPICVEIILRSLP